jgi:hypothetical protein
MTQARDDYQDTALQRAPALTIRAAEARRGSAGARPPETPPPRAEERLSPFWRVFCGAMLSIAALVVVALYQQFVSGVNELRNDLVRLNEARSDLVKKDELNARLAPMWNGVNDAKAAVRDKQARQEQQFKQDDEERKAIQREVQLLRERLTKLEARQAGTKPAAAKADTPE